MPLVASARHRVLLGVVTVAAAVAGCAGPAPVASSSVGMAGQPLPVRLASLPQPAGAVVGPLRGGRLTPDVLVSRSTPLAPAELRRVAALAPGSVAYATGLVRIGGAQVRVASVDPTTFRRYAAAGTAESTPVWQVVAGGGLLAAHEVAQSLHLALGTDVVLQGARPIQLHLGGLATTGIPGTGLIVDLAAGQALGIGSPTTVLLNAGAHDPTSLAAKVRSVTGGGVDVQLLRAPAAGPVAFLTGSRAAHAFGAFSYTYFADGTIQPDAAWVRANIASATVPILGRVTCHRLMFPQLRGALQDVVNAGLASSLHTYNGCYVPRFIEHDPTHAISLHTWGIAIDLDAASNYRGIRGTMDPRVVAIFKRWGFRWGGDWTYTDPMHFELGALLATPASTSHHRHRRS